MKHISLAFIVCIILSTVGCLKDDCTSNYTYTLYNPVHMSPEEMRSSIALEEPRELDVTGKLYFYNDHFFVNELGKGIHIFDNQDMTNPTPIGFLKIPGNYDMAIKNGMLYADNSLDLIRINITDINNPSVVDIDEEVYQFGLSEQGVILYYEETEETIEVSCNDVFPGEIFWLEDGSGGFDPNIDSPVISNEAGGSDLGQVGIGGSFARFTINQNHLYTVDQSQLRTWTLAQCDNPELIGELSLDWGVETIFSLDDRIFVGSDSGVFIFDNSNPAQPVWESEFVHARACDPVYVEGDVAYVTLRNGSACAGFVNQLDIIDVTNLSSPELIESHEMTNPHGLTVKDKIVFLCEGTAGLRILDANDPRDLNELKHIDDFHAYDIIRLSDKVLMIIGDDGFYQYQYDAEYDLELLSHIPTI